MKASDVFLYLLMTVFIAIIFTYLYKFEVIRPNASWRYMKALDIFLYVLMTVFIAIMFAYLYKFGAL